MTIAIARREPFRNGAKILGAAASAVAAVAILQIATSGDDGSSVSPVPSVTETPVVASDPVGLGAALSVQVPTETPVVVSDPVGLGAALSVQVP